MRERAGVVVAGAANLALLVLPLAVTGHAARALVDPPTCAFLTLATLFCVTELTTQAGEGSAVDDVTAVRLARATGLAMLAVFWGGLLRRDAQTGTAHAALVIAGALLMISGVALRRAAIRALGDFFVSDTRVWPGQKLVTTGIYARMRHPSETGLLAIALGSAALLQSEAALAVAILVMAPLVIVRIRREDRHLARAFASEHARYASRVGAFL